MNAKLLSLTLAAASTLSAGAADVKVTAFPPTRPESPQLQAKPMNAPLNQERKKGLKVFGTSYIDYNRSRSFVNYYENQFLLDRLSTVATAEEVQQSGIPDLYVFLDVERADHDHNLRAVGQLGEHSEFAVGLETGQYPACVEVVEKFASEFEIEFVAELSDTLFDMFRLDP